MEYVKTEVRDRVAVLTLDDPARRNALSLDMAEAVAASLARVETDPDVAAVVVTGAPPAFSAGADLDDLAAASRERLGRIYEGFLALARFPLPTIAAVNGPAVGAGLNLALACDLRIAGAGAHFESRFLDLALHPGGGHGWMLDRILGPQGAAAMVLLGQGLSGEEAARCGLAWRVVPDEALRDTALEIAARAAVAPLELMRRMKSTLREEAALKGHDDAVALELEVQLWSTEQPAFRDRLEALRRRIAQRRSR
jgi:enoyl-CoA hydratase